jgi:hypothetical protein
MSVMNVKFPFVIMGLPFESIFKVLMVIPVAPIVR